MSAINQPLAATQETDAIGARNVHDERPAKVPRHEISRNAGASLSTIIYHTGPLSFNSSRLCKYVPFLGMHQPVLDAMWDQVTSGRRSSMIKGRAFYAEIQIYYAMMLFYRIAFINHKLAVLHPDHRTFYRTLEEQLLGKATVPPILVDAIESLSATSHPHYPFIYFPILPKITYSHNSGALERNLAMRIPSFPALWRILAHKYHERNAFLNLNAARTHVAPTDAHPESLHNNQSYCCFIMHRHEVEITAQQQTSAKINASYAEATFPDVPAVSLAGFTHLSGFMKNYSRLSQTWEYFCTFFPSGIPLETISIEASPSALVSANFTTSEYTDLETWIGNFSSSLPLAPPGLHIAMAYAPNAAIDDTDASGTETSYEPTCDGEGWTLPYCYSGTNPSIIPHIRTYVQSFFKDGGS